MSTKNKIPSDEEFKQAEKKMEYRHRGISDVVKRVLYKYNKVNGLYDFYLFAYSEVTFEAFFFFSSKKWVKFAQESGFTQELIDFVFHELEKVGRGSKSDIQVNFVFDSKENILERVR